jgi:uncharacterized membrane protein YeaQ/YmgE (transglycosylase-associated protein family)
MISLVLWLVFGFIAGSIAEWLYPPAVPQPRWKTIAIGVVGSVCGGLLGSIITGSRYAPGGLVMSVAGALLCMFVWAKYNEVH